VDFNTQARQPTPIVGDLTYDLASISHQTIIYNDHGYFNNIVDSDKILLIYSLDIILAT